MCRGLVRADECLVMRDSLLAASALLHETPGIDLQIYMRITVQIAEMTKDSIKPTELLFCPSGESDRA